MPPTFTFAVPAACERLFREAGWIPGRKINCRSINDDPAIQAGLKLLAEFGGLSVGGCGSGQECATSDIQFANGDSSVDLELLCRVEALAGERLFPVGSDHREYGELFVNARGLMYIYGIPDGSVWLVGESFEDALERLLLGRHPLRQLGIV